MNSDQPETIACEICKKEIPKSAALQAEGEDYVLYFCDIKCLDYWKQGQVGLPEGKKEED